MKILHLAILIIVCSLQTGYSQFDLLDKIKEKVEEKVDATVDKAVDEGAEKVEEEVTKNKDSGENAENNKNVKSSDSDKPARLTYKGYSKYDFIPGEKVVFYEDFSQDNIGDFPALWFTNKSGEVMTTNLQQGKWFQMKEDGQYLLEKGFKFPENFTLEFDVIPVEATADAQSVGFDMTLLQTNQGELYPSMYVPGKGGVNLCLYTYNGQHSITGYYDSNYGVSGDYDKEPGLLKRNEINHVAIWVQKTRVRLYLHGEKIFDLPKVYPSDVKFDQIRFYLNGYSSPLFSNFRIAEAVGDMRSKFLAEGKLVTHGILFDVNKDKIKPESYGVLKVIAGALKDNQGVKAKIVGHTDGDGADEANLDLSKRRAAAVMNSLVNEFGIEASRLEAGGKGESEPVSDNKTPEGKANNRRVEFIKM